MIGPIRNIPGLPSTEAAALKIPVGADDTGALEAQLLSRGFSAEDIEKQAATAEHRRNERFRDHFENIAILCLWLVALLFLAVGGTWFWHILMPEKWHWLTADQVSKLQNLVTGGILTGIAAGHIKKRMS